MPDSCWSITSADWCSGWSLGEEVDVVGVDAQAQVPRRPQAPSTPRVATASTGCAWRIEKRATRCIGPDQVALLRRDAVLGLQQHQQRRHEARATSRSRPSRRPRRRCRTRARRRRRWWRATAGRAPWCRWRRAAATNRCSDARLERVLLAARRAQLVVEVLHDVHVVGDRQDHHQRRQHAGEHVVAEPHQHEQAHRPDDADEHGARSAAR